MALSFPSYIRVVNPRLQLLHLLLMTAVCIAVVVQFIAYSHYTTRLPGRGVVTMRTVAPNDWTQLQEFFARKALEPFCASAEKYDYWADKDGFERYDNHSCIQLCAYGTISSGCLGFNEASFDEAWDSVFFATQIHEIILKGPQPKDNSSASDTNWRNYFVPVVEAMSLDVSYTYYLAESPWYRTTLQTLMQSTHSSLTDATTVVLDHQQNYRRVVAAGEDLVFFVPELLDLAGYALDTIQPALGRNFRGGAASANGPYLRTSGIDIEVWVRCVEGRELNIGHDIDVDGPVCYLTVTPTPKWTKHAKAPDMWDPDGGRMRWYHGIRVRSRMEASNLIVNINAIFLNLAASAVFFQIPYGVLFIITLWAMGHTSRIYRRAVFRHFDISMELGSMAMRLLEHHVSFQTLTSAGTNVITKDTMRDYFDVILSRRGATLDADEIERMVGFCLQTLQHSSKQDTNSAWRTFLDEAVDGVASVAGDFRELWHSKKYSGIPEACDLDSFEVACTSAEPICFDAFVKLFDQDRKLSLIERLFMPTNLREHLNGLRHIVADKKEFEETAVEIDNESGPALAAADVPPEPCDVAKPIDQDSPAHLATLPQELYRRSKDLSGASTSSFATHHFMKVNRIDEITALGRDMALRMDALEKRYDDLEKRFQTKNELHSETPAPPPVLYRLDATAPEKPSDASGRVTPDFDASPRSSTADLTRRLDDLQAVMERDLAALREMVASDSNGLRDEMRVLQERLRSRESAYQDGAENPNEHTLSATEVAAWKEMVERDSMALRMGSPLGSVSMRQGPRSVM